MVLQIKFQTRIPSSKYMTDFFSIFKALEKDLSYYEILKKSDLNRRVRRSVDPRPQAAIHEVWFESFGR